MDDLVEVKPSSKSISRPRRWMVRFGMAIVGSAAAALLAPSLVGWLGLTGSISTLALGRSGATVQVERASLAWWSPIRVEGVRITTAAGEVSATIETASTERTLLSLCVNPKQIGLVKIQRPTISAQVASIDMPKRQPKASDDSTDPVIGRWLDGVSARVEFAEGSVEIQDAVTRERRRIQNVRGVVAVPGGEKSDIHVEVAAELAESAQASHIEFSGDIQNDRRDGTLAALRVQVKSAAFPLEVVNPLLASIGVDARLSGSLTCEEQIDIDRRAGVASLSGTAEVRPFMAAASAIAPDQVSLSTLRVTGQWIARSDGMEVKDAVVDCDLGHLRGKGRLDWTGPQAGAVPSMEVDGSVNLAKLVRMLPHVVRVRDDVQINAGELALSLRPAGGAADRIDANVEVRGLVAMRKGAAVEWPKPVALHGRVGRHPTDRVVVDDFRCESDFFRAKGAGSLSSFDVTAACDLGLLQQRVGQLLDLGQTHLGGKLTARVQSEKSADGKVRIRGAAKGESLDIREGIDSLVLEPSLQAQFQAIVVHGDVLSVDACTLVVKSERDELTARLESAISDVSRSWGTWQVDAKGDLANYLRRARPWTGPVEDWKVAGTGTFAGRVSLDGPSTRLDSVHVGLHDFVAVTRGYRIADPSVDISTSGEWRNASSALLLGETKIRAAAGQAHWNQAIGEIASDGLRITAEGTVDVDLAKVRAWTLAPPQQADLAGQLVSRVSLRSKGGRWTANLDGRIDNPRYGVDADPWVVAPRADVAGRMDVDFTSDDLGLDGLRLAIPGLAVVAKGTVKDLSKSQTLAIDGVCEYDLAALTPRIRALLGSGVEFAGSDRRPFTLAGPLAAGDAGLRFASSTNTADAYLPWLSGKGSFGWQRASLWGFVAGPATVDCVLKESWLLTRPVQFPLSGGKVELRPGIYFGRDVTYLHHPAGTLADHVEVSREMCDGALQYVAPVLAKAVDVAGDASLSVGEVRVALGHLDRADFAGKLLLHNVKASGSPLIRELVVLTDGKPIIDIASESEVPFRVSGGRVYHENLQIRLPGLVVKTSGSVGFDQTLALTAEMPIPKRWVGSGDVGKQFEGKSIKVPIGGTLEHPKLDQKALQREIGKGIQKGAGEAVEKEINKQIDKQLNKLFDKIK